MNAQWATRAGSSGLLVFDFWATWCGPCAAVGRELLALAQETGTPVVMVDVDADPEAALEAKIAAVPTLVLYRDGIEVGRATGGGAAAWLRDRIASSY